MEEGGCSKPVWQPDCRAMRMICLERLWISVLWSTLRCSAGLLSGTPSMCSGARSALGPGRRSLRRENSLQGRADHRAPRRPLEAMRSKRRYCALSTRANAVGGEIEGLKAVGMLCFHGGGERCDGAEKRSRKSLGAGERLHAAGCEDSTDELLEELDGERRRFAGGECNGGADGAGSAATWLAAAAAGRAVGMRAVADGTGAWLVPCLCEGLGLGQTA